MAEIGSHGFPRVSRHGWKWSHWPAITTIIVMDIAHFSTRVLLMSAEILMKRKNQGTSWGGLRGDFGGFFVFWREYAKTKMGSEGRLWAAHSRRWGRRGDFGFRVFYVIPLLLTEMKLEWIESDWLALEIKLDSPFDQSSNLSNICLIVNQWVTNHGFINLIINQIGCVFYSW